ncbi:MAG: alpha/beta fold hydrolase [Rhodospirillaceae bacterium]|nr:MAG: alpha/beta fold hydrolase [Rhodospirillaceae bacterium]
MGLALLVSACASLNAQPGPAITPPQLEADGFVAADGAVLPGRRWMPDAGQNPGQNPRAVVLALHGFNDYSKAFDTAPGAPGVGPFLAARGFAVFAYDQRGFGRAPHFGLWPGGAALAADFTAFARVLRARYPGVPLYGLGESMGGAVVMTALAGTDPPPLDGAILVAPAVWARSTMPWYYRAALWTSVHVMPGWKPTGRNLGRQASDNIDMLKDNGRDPLFIKHTRIDSVFGLVDLMDEAMQAADKQKLPVLYLTGRNDQIIPPKAAAQAMDRLLATDPLAKGAFYDQGWHMMLRDHDAATVLGDIAAFLADRLAPLPSGADADAMAHLRARAQKPWVGK